MWQIWPEQNAVCDCWLRVLRFVKFGAWCEVDPVGCLRRHFFLVGVKLARPDAVC